MSKNFVKKSKICSFFVAFFKNLMLFCSFFFFNFLAFIFSILSGSPAKCIQSYNFHLISMKIKKNMIRKTTFAFFDRTTRPGGAQGPFWVLWAKCIKSYNFHPILMKFKMPLKKIMLRKTTFAFFYLTTRAPWPFLGPLGQIYLVYFFLWNFIDVAGRHFRYAVRSLSSYKYIYTTLYHRLHIFSI